MAFLQNCSLSHTHPSPPPPISKAYFKIHGTWDLSHLLERTARQALHVTNVAAILKKEIHGPISVLDMASFWPRNRDGSQFCTIMVIFSVRENYSSTPQSHRSLQKLTSMTLIHIAYIGFPQPGDFFFGEWESI